MHRHTHTHTHWWECSPRQGPTLGQIVHLVRVEMAAESMEKADALITTTAPVDKHKEGLQFLAQLILLRDDKEDKIRLT